MPFTTVFCVILNLPVHTKQRKDVVVIPHGNPGWIEMDSWFTINPNTREVAYFGRVPYYQDKVYDDTTLNENAEICRLACSYEEAVDLINSGDGDSHSLDDVFLGYKNIY